MRTRPIFFSVQADRGQIEDRFRGFDCALIPIGYVKYNFLWQLTYDLTIVLSRYLPHQVMYPVHHAPQDSVRLFRDIPQDPRKSGSMVDTDPDRKFQNEGARLDTNRTGF